MTRTTHLRMALASLGKALAALVLAVSCAPPTVPQPAPSPSQIMNHGSCCERTWGTRSKATHTTRLTAYFPDASPMEGGFHTRFGDDLSTLQGFLAGKHKHVSVALDKNLGRVKRRMCSPDLERAYGKPIKLLVEDTGGAFTGKQFSRADICVSNRAESLKKSVNQTVTMIECE